MEKPGWIDGTQMERHGTTESGTIMRRPNRTIEEELKKPEDKITSKDSEVPERK